MTSTLAKVADPYNPAANAETFDLDAYLAQFDERLLAHPAGRRTLTEVDPLLFALVYLRDHLTSAETGGEVTLADMHLAWARRARQWLIPVTQPAPYRAAEVAPRNTGKTTWWFLIIPLWLAAHGHSKFIGAFADSGPQAEMHLQTFKQELDRNALLRKDFPLLCKPLERTDRRTRVSDSKKMTIQANGFVFAAKGVDAGNLGMKVGKHRPDTIILDDVEPGEEVYSAYQAGQRLIALTDSIMPINVYARVVLCGTTTMVGSIIHQMVKSVLEPNEPAPAWIAAEKFQVNYHPPIVVRDDASERSCWPSRWSMAFLNAIKDSRQFLKNYKNLPAGQGDYWSIDDIEQARQRGAKVTATTHGILSIDPATTSKKSSDRTAFAALSLAPADKTVVLEECRAVQLPPAQCRQVALEFLESHPNIRKILIESNQGGDTWLSVYHSMPVPVELITQSEPKDVRAARLLNHTQRKHFAMRGRQPAFEDEALSFPRGAHDDTLDAVGTGTDYLLKTRRQPQRSGSQSYV